jgi:hypothetical protein
MNFIVDRLGNGLIVISIFSFCPNQRRQFPSEGKKPGLQGQNKDG